MDLSSGEVDEGDEVDQGGEGGEPAVDRPAAFAAGTPKMSRTVVYWAVAAVLLLGLGGTLVDHFLSSSGPSSATTLTSTTGSTPTTSPPAIDQGKPPLAGAHQVHASLAAFMGLTSQKATPAPAFSLTDGDNGATVSLSSLRGHVVVLTFANAGCNDICPVLADELAKADALLGHTPVPVTFVTVNTDPLDLSGVSTAPVLRQTTLPSLPNWQFLTGTIAQLDPVWKAYGVSITADRSTGTVTHNDVLYFIRPDGTLAWSATPFANESTAGVFSLPAAQVTRFAKGIATYADELAQT